MPQLDQFTYLTQIVWLCLSFMGYYVIVYNYGLPKISRLLKLRARLLTQQNNESTEISDETFRLADSTESANELSVLTDCGHYLNSSVIGASEWCSAMVDGLNANELQPTNKAYMRSLTEMNVSHHSKSKALSSLTALTADSIRVAESFGTSNKESNWKTSTIKGSSVLNALLVVLLRRYSLLHLKENQIGKKQLSTNSKLKSANLSQSRSAISKKLNKKNA